LRRSGRPKRDVFGASSADEAPKTSRFGRPLRRKGAQPAAATAATAGVGGDA